LSGAADTCISNDQPPSDTLRCEVGPEADDVFNSEEEPCENETTVIKECRVTKDTALAAVETLDHGLKCCTALYDTRTSEDS